MEIWKEIKDYNGSYEASNYGAIRSLNYAHTNTTRELKQETTKFGYKRVVLCKDGVAKRYLIHRLIAETFIENQDNKPCIDHIDGNRGNNAIDNLRWCTYSENLHNPITHTKRCTSLSGEHNPMFGVTSEKHPNSKKITQYTMDGSHIKQWNSIVDASKSLGLNRCCIKDCCRGRQKSAGGYLWKYA